jgi:poly(A) polymerase
VAWARSPATTHDPAWRALASLSENWTAPVFPLKAADFIKRGVPPGPALGAALHEAEQAWIAADFPSDGTAVAAIADAAVADVRPM